MKSFSILLAMVFSPMVFASEPAIALVPDADPAKVQRLLESCKVEPATGLIEFRCEGFFAFVGDKHSTVAVLESLDATILGMGAAGGGVESRRPATLRVGQRTWQGE